MTDKLDQFEIQREIFATLKSFDEKTQRVIMAGLAEHLNLKLVEKSTGTGRNYKPYLTKKHRY